MRTILFDCIEVVYNRTRHQHGLGDRTPRRRLRCRTRGLICHNPVSTRTGQPTMSDERRGAVRCDTER